MIARRVTTLALVALCSTAAMAQSNMRVIGAKLEADPANYAGICPTTIRFHGTIETNGPGVVKYIFERSDGAIDTIVKSVTFTAAPFHISIPDETWTLGGAGMTYSGWERIKILAPNAGFLSNEAHFQIRCAGAPSNKPGNPGYPGYPGAAATSTSTQRGKPDLVVISFGFTGPVAAAAAPLCKPQMPVYIFQVTVRNEGTAASPSSASLGNKALVQVMAQDKAGWGNGVYLNALAPGATQTVTVPVYYLMSDPVFMTTHVPHPFLAIVDPLNLVAESNESNNTKGPINMGPPAGCPRPPNAPK
ncbi:MAG TPA: CARDB domain-containing protein [Thermoanaerobaculia bacterium]|nr:CARDB domain-containing protein [Thermoanaerobaculia bacterium]